MPSPTPAHRPRSAALAAGALCLAVLAGACSSTNSSTDSSSPSTTGAPAPTAPGTPLDAAALQATLDATAKELLTPGAVVVIRTPGGDFRATYGTTTAGGSTPISLDDHVRIGSNTKTFTGTVVLQLAQEGRLGLDDPVSQYRPDVPGGQDITIAQLLDMRSGLFNYSETLELNQSLDTNPGKVWTPDELLALAFEHPPYFPPGEGYHYSNTNTVLLGLIAEQLDGKPLAQIFQDRLFTPLGLSGTSFPPSTTSAMPDRHPQGYMFGTNVGTMATAELPADQQAAAAAGTLQPADVTDENPSWTWAAGQAISTADDQATWVRAMNDGTLLDPEWQQRRTDSLQSTRADGTGPKYGLGVAQMGPLLGHIGELPGFNSFMGYDPATQLTIVVWTNLSQSPDGRQPASTIAAALLARITGSSAGASDPSKGATGTGG
jgi:D-alanyl-D-alanine carboxypeptidase